MYAGLLGALGRGAIGIAADAAAGAIGDTLSKGRLGSEIVEENRRKDLGNRVRTGKWSDNVIGVRADTENSFDSPVSGAGNADSEYNQQIGNSGDGLGGDPYSQVDKSGMERVNYKEMLDHLDKRDQKNFKRDARYAGAARLGNALGGNVDSSQWWGNYASIPS